MSYILETRAAMEARLSTMSGLEFIVASAPTEQAPGTGTGVWIIRKQVRRKRVGEEDEVIVRNTYFCVGENIYMAPAVSDVLRNRMLSILKDVNDFVTLTSTLPTTSAPQTKKPTRIGSDLGLDTPASQLSRRPSTSNTPSDSRPTTSQTDQHAQNLLLEESLLLSFQYGDEYMDENPITGQPGDFHFSNTGRKAITTSTNKLLNVPGMGNKEPLKISTEITASTVAAVMEVGEGASPLTAKGEKKGTKSPRTPGGLGKVRRKKSRSGTVDK